MAIPGEYMHCSTERCECPKKMQNLKRSETSNLREKQCCHALSPNGKDSCMT